MKVLITPRGFANYGIDIVRELEEKGITVHYNDTGKAYTSEEFIRYAKDADGIIVGVDTMDRRMMEQCPNLKVVCKFGVGTDNIDLEYAKERGIYVGRTVGSNSRSVAEHVIAMMFADAKNICTTVNGVKNGKWDKPTGMEIGGKTLGIIGFGQIGRHLAKMANGLGMRVLAYDAFTISDETAEEYQVEKAEFDDIIRFCDYISLHVPLTEDTKNLISDSEFTNMKDSACLLNAARGGVVDEGALYRALTEKKIRSACFDVYSVEPPKEGDPLVKLDNFLLTSHIGARSKESERRTCEMSAEIVMTHLLEGEK